MKDMEEAAMAHRGLQSMSVDDGEPFNINGAVFVIDGGQVVTQAHYTSAKGRERPLCAICDTSEDVRICAECSRRLMDEAHKAMET